MVDCVHANKEGIKNSHLSTQEECSIICKIRSGEEDRVVCKFNAHEKDYIEALTTCDKIKVDET